MSATFFFFNEAKQREMKRGGEGNGRRGGERGDYIKDRETRRDGEEGLRLSGQVSQREWERERERERKRE